MLKVKLKADSLYRNKFDTLIILIITALIFGGLGGALQPVRLIAIISFLPVAYKLIQLNYPVKAQYYLLGAVVFLCFAFFSFSWSLDRAQGVKNFFYFLLHFTLFFLLILTSYKSRNPLKSVIIGWIVFLTLSLPFAYYEIITMNHFTNWSTSEEVVLSSGVVASVRWAGVFFGNLNSYVTMVCFSLPFLLAGFFVFNKKRTIFVLIGILLLTIGVLFFNASRGGLLVLSIYLLVFFWLFIFKSKKFSSFIRNVILLSFLSIILANVISYLDWEIFSRFVVRFSKDDTYGDSARVIIWKASFQAFLDNHMLGSGIGGERKLVEQTGMSNITIPHNLVLEVLVQFGIFGFVLFLLFLFGIFNRVLYVKNKASKYILLVAILAFAPLFIIDSGYLLNPGLWLFFASLYIVGDKVHNARPIN